MARRKTKSPSPLKRWWRSQSEYHYQAYTFMTLFCLAASLYSFILLFFMDYANEASETMITLTWVGLIGGAIALFLFMTRIRSPGSMAPTEPSSSCIIDPDSTTTIGGKEPVEIHIEPSRRTTNPSASDPSLTNGLTVRVSELSESESGASSDTSFLLGASSGRDH